MSLYKYLAHGVLEYAVTLLYGLWVVQMLNIIIVLLLILHNALHTAW